MRRLKVDTSFLIKQNAGDRLKIMSATRNQFALCRGARSRPKSKRARQEANLSVTLELKEDTDHGH
jgi:hypothetical protein